MDELQLIRRWYDYNAGVRRKYFELLSRLPKEELKRDRGASFPSLLDIYAHVLDAYRWWFVYVLENRLSDYRRLAKHVQGLDALEKEEENVNRVVYSVIGRLRPEELESTVVFDNTREGRREKIVMRDMLWHMVEEELQHRGEMNALLWQMDIDPPITGWDDWWAERR